jgi:hypothetical protein
MSNHPNPQEGEVLKSVSHQIPAPDSSVAAYGRSAIAAALLSSGLLCASASAQAQSEASVEGPLTAVTNLGGGSGSVVCNGSFIQIAAGTPITSPTATLTMAQLADPTPFPNSGFNPATGAARAGFIGGTCIIDAVRDDVTGAINASNVFVEVAENVIVGAVTNSPALGNGAFAVLGTPIVPLTDARMPATKLAAGFYGPTGVHAGNTEVARNDFGFGVDLNTVGLPAPDIATVEGYFGSDGALHAHIIETTGGTPLSLDPRPSATLAQCRDRNTVNKDELEVRGGCVLARAGVAQAVSLSGHTATGALIQTYGTATCTPDLVDPRFGAFRYIAANLNYIGNTCPVRVRVTLSGSADNRRHFIDSVNRED